MSIKRRDITNEELETELLRVQGGLFADVSMAGWFILGAAIICTLYTHLVGLGFVTEIVKALVIGAAYILVIAIVAMITIVAWVERGMGSGLAAKIMKSGAAQQYNKAVTAVAKKIDVASAGANDCKRCGRTDNCDGWKFCEKCGAARGGK